MEPNGRNSTEAFHFSERDLRPWYGPLVDLRSTIDHVGGVVQLVGLVQQVVPGQLITTRRGQQVLKMAVKLGDDTRSYFEVALWGSHAKTEVSVGDIVFLRNISIRSFRDRVEGSTQMQSSIRTLLRCHDLVNSQGKKPPTDRTCGGTFVRQRFAAVIDWALYSQVTLLSLAAGSAGLLSSNHRWSRPQPGPSVEGPIGRHRASTEEHLRGERGLEQEGRRVGQDGKARRREEPANGREDEMDGQRETEGREAGEEGDDVDGQATRLATVADIGRASASSIFEFQAWVAQLVIPRPPDTQSESDTWQQDVAWCSQGGPTSQANREALKALIGYGCLDCGREWPLNTPSSCCRRRQTGSLDPSRKISDATRQSLREAEASPKGTTDWSMGWIYRPFSIHVWDQTSQVALHVRNKVAEQMLAGISAELVKASMDFQEGQLKRPHIKKHIHGLTSITQLSTLDSQTAPRIEAHSLVLILIDALVKQGCNSMFHFRVHCRVVENKEWHCLESMLTLLTFGAPPPEK